MLRFFPTDASLLDRGKLETNGIARSLDDIHRTAEKRAALNERQPGQRWRWCVGLLSGQLIPAIGAELCPGRDWGAAIGAEIHLPLAPSA